MDDLNQMRKEIDRIDRESANLFRRRMDVVRQIGAYKTMHGLPVTDTMREAEVLAQAIDTSDGNVNGLYSAFHRTVVDLSRRYQEMLRAPESALHFGFAYSSCDIVLESGCIARINELLDLKRRVLIVTDNGVPTQYARSVADACTAPRVITVAGGDGCKSLEILSSLLDAMLEHGLTRQDCVIAVGGGSVCDLAGFAASIYARGIEHYNIPTTLLAQVDAGVGGKTGINFRGIKNAVGTFSQPRKILIDPDVLKTLPERQTASGLAEALKVGVTLDPDLFMLFEQDDPHRHMDAIIRSALAQKIRIVSSDERESGLRRVLNFGHTIGHAIEMLHPELLHGECVALGMLAMCSNAVFKRLLPIYEKLHLPTCCPVDTKSAAELILHDKKRVGSEILAVEAPEIGQYRIRPMSVEELMLRIVRITKGA